MLRISISSSEIEFSCTERSTDVRIILYVCVACETIFRKSAIFNGEIFHSSPMMRTQSMTNKRNTRYNIYFTTQFRMGHAITIVHNTNIDYILSYMLFSNMIYLYNLTWCADNQTLFEHTAQHMRCSNVRQTEMCVRTVAHTLAFLCEVSKCQIWFASHTFSKQTQFHV